MRCVEEVECLNTTEIELQLPPVVSTNQYVQELSVRIQLLDTSALPPGHYLPVPEVLVWDPVREAFATNTDALKHTVAGQLMHYQGSIDHTCDEDCCVLSGYFCSMFRVIL